jgi:hypothetical protein
MDEKPLHDPHTFLVLQEIRHEFQYSKGNPTPLAREEIGRVVLVAPGNCDASGATICYNCSRQSIEV